jgi:RNA polymerase sigma-70 factor (ECF subfamily)
MQHRIRNREVMGTRTDDLIPTRQSLLSRLKDWEDQASWKTFFDTYWRLIYGVARKAGLNDAEAQDVVQETVVSVAKKMPEFKYDPIQGSFKSWLLQLTRWRIADALRKKHYEKDGRRYPREEPLRTSLLEHQPDLSACNLERVWEEEWIKNVTEVALDRVKKQANARQYQMFYLHVVKKMPATDVARRLGAKLPEVYFAKYKISALIKKQVKLLENRML